MWVSVIVRTTHLSRSQSLVLDTLDPKLKKTPIMVVYAVS